MPQTYRALVCSRLSNDFSGLAIERRAVPVPGPGEALVRVRAASVNFPDLLMTQGLYQFKPALPFVPGIEGAGVIVALGAAMPHDPAPPGAPPAAAAPARALAGGDRTGADAPAWRARVGDRVLLHSRTGAFAEFACVPVAELRPIPASLDFAQGAAFQAAAVTAYVSLVRRAALQPGETLLVHGATGGVGMATVQLGKHLDARVIATGTSDDKLARLRAMEGVETVNLSEGLRERVLAMTDGRGADVIFDPVGGDVFDASVRCIAWGGRLLVVGFASGRIASLAMNLPLIKGFSIVGVRAGEYGRRDPVRGAQNLRAVDRLALEGVFRPHISARFPLERAADALREISGRRVLGKVVIEMPDAD
jgi:NADPH2:quinone reductase